MIKVQISTNHLFCLEFKSICFLSILFPSTSPHTYVKLISAKKGRIFWLATHNHSH